ncbi:MAG: permease prefix domain 1-containing protein [Treponema sp.]|nr:permease prefix domain 1-containing protein [Treponema sp.]
MKEKIYVDRMFADYEETPEIRDFKEEITGNLKERVKELSVKMDEEAAFEKAAAELGDIKAIADEIGKKKRNEAIGQMYMRTKVPLTKRTAIGMTAASAFLLLAAGIALIVFFGGTGSMQLYYLSAVLLSIACGLYTHFGLTQETAAHYEMKKSRALVYGIICFLGFLGASISVVSFFFSGFAISQSVAVKTIIILPAICALIFMLATEPKRQKPWLKAMIDREVENSLHNFVNAVDPAKASRFGVASAGMWILAIAIFITLGLIIGWQFSWLVFLFALAIQVFMLTSILGSKN